MHVLVAASRHLFGKPMPAKSVGVFIESKRRRPRKTKQRTLARSTMPHVAQNHARAGGSAIDAHHAARRIQDQPAETEAHRRMFRLAEDDCGAAQSAAPRSWQSGLDLHLRLRRLQPGAHAKLGDRSSVVPAAEDGADVGLLRLEL